MHYGRDKTKPQEHRGFTDENEPKNGRLRKRRLHKRERWRGKCEASFDPVKFRDDELDYYMDYEMLDYDSFGDYFDEEAEAVIFVGNVNVHCVWNERQKSPGPDDQSTSQELD